ncbi:MAG: hypothetical protein GY746_05530, partial [Gammaproteobacteria bacterium]|nr:hypothetical protein [Gammaproteobacteria bacterium]
GYIWNQTSADQSAGFRIDGDGLFSSGNVGIGTTSPSNRLDIASQARTDSHASGRPLYVTGNIGETSNGVEIRHSNGSQGVGIGYQGIYATGSNANQPLQFLSKGTGDLKFKTNATERMLIDGATGNIGIGTTTPGNDLEIEKNEAMVDLKLYSTNGSGVGHLITGANGGGLINLIANSSASTYKGVPVGYSGIVTDYTDMIFATGTGASATEKMRIETGGNVSIGTPTPYANLHVADPDGATLYLTREVPSTAPVADDVLGSLYFDSSGGTPGNSTPSTNDASAVIRGHASRL